MSKRQEQEKEREEGAGGKRKSLHLKSHSFPPAPAPPPAAAPTAVTSPGWCMRHRRSIRPAHAPRPAPVAGRGRCSSARRRSSSCYASSWAGRSGDKPRNASMPEPSTCTRSGVPRQPLLRPVPASSLPAAIARRVPVCRLHRPSLFPCNRPPINRLMG